VHGVGGSHGPRMLGFDSAHDVVVVGEGVGGTSVLARRNDPSVESYEWGDLTSGTGIRLSPRRSAPGSDAASARSVSGVPSTTT